MRNAASILAILLTHAVAQTTPAPKYPAFPSETPTDFKPVTDSFDYVKRDVMIPMRDGVKLHTVILLPNSPCLKSFPSENVSA